MKRLTRGKLLLEDVEHVAKDDSLLTMTWVDDVADDAGWQRSKKDMCWTLSG